MAGEPIVVQWATLANYPAGGNPWNSQPLKVAPAQFYFTPNIPLPAENMNYELNAITALLAAAAQGPSLAAAANWDEPISNLDPANILGTAVTTATWDAYHEQWIAYVSDLGTGSTGAEVLSTFDGKTWKIITGLHATTDPTLFAVGVAVDPTNGQFVAVRSDDATAVKSTIGHQETGTTTVAIPGVTSVLGTGSLIAVNGGGLFYFIGNDANRPTFTGLGLSYNGTSWTVITSSLPAAWQSSTNETGQYLSEQSISQVVFAMCGLRPGTDQSRLLTIGSFQDCTPSLLTVHHQLRGLAYDKVNQLWGILEEDDSSPINLRVWTTPDPITPTSTWTNAHTFVGYHGGGLAVIGSVWCVLLQGTASSPGSSIYYSGNVTFGATSTLWSRADYFDNITMSTILPADRLLSNGSQILRISIFGQSAPTPTAVSGKSGWQPSSSNGL